MRMAKGLSQKEVIVAGSLDKSQLSRIENGHIDPSYTTIKRIADAMGVSLSELFATSDDLQEVKSLDKSIMEKVNMIELLDDKEKQAIYSILDAFLGKKKLKDALANVLDGVE